MAHEMKLPTCTQLVKNTFLNKVPGEGNGNPLQYSCLENPMDRGAGGLQSMGSQSVGHDLVTKQQQS